MKIQLAGVAGDEKKSEEQDSGDLQSRAKARIQGLNERRGPSSLRLQRRAPKPVVWPRGSGALGERASSSVVSVRRSSST